MTKPIHDAIIDAYGNATLQNLRITSGQKFSSAIKMLLLRDYPHLAKHFKWGGFQIMLNHLEAAIKPSRGM